MAEALSLKEKLAWWREHGGLQISPAATPNRRNANPPRVSESANAWERGVPRDHRGMPYLDDNLNPIGQKRYAQTRRSYEEARRLPPPSRSDP